METQDKELLVKALCGYLPYGVKAQYFNPEDCREDIDTIVGADFDAKEPRFDIFEYGFEVTKFKPYLRPMSSMTEKEQKIFNDEYCVINEDCWMEKGLVGYINQARIIAEGVDWLNAHHFDYRGLIDKGLAIKVTEENNPYK